MVSVKFVAKCPKTNTKMHSSKSFYYAINETVIRMIEAKRVQLKLQFPDFVVLALVVNEE
jgi:hypothetical protein